MEEQPDGSFHLSQKQICGVDTRDLSECHSEKAKQ